MRGVFIVTVAKVTELSAESDVSFEKAIQNGMDRANETLENVRSAWVKEQTVTVENGEIDKFRANLKITFVLDE